MFKKNKKGFYEFEEFKKFKNLVLGVSTREFGDCHQDRGKFFKAVGLKKENLVLMEQIHGNKIKVVKNEDRGRIIPGVDGLITNVPGIILGVRTADCLPILFYDPVAKNIGACHAGWKGILARVAQKMVDLLIKKGSSPLNILVGIGPYICPQCYLVEKDRARRFLVEFGKGEVHLDLLAPTKIQLIHSGILVKNIFVAGRCTACQNREFFSYRRDSQKDYGEILSLITLIKA